MSTVEILTEIKDKLLPTVEFCAQEAVILRANKILLEQWSAEDVARFEHRLRAELADEPHWRQDERP